MKRQGEIILHIQCLDQLIAPHPPSPFLNRRLREDAEKFIIEQAGDIRRNSDTKVIVYLPESEAARTEAIRAAFQQHFAFRRDEAEKELKRLQRFGWRSLLVAFVFLGIMIALIQIIKHFIPAGNFSPLLLEGLTILGWVALWRPGELLLYEWYPYKRDARIYSQLERAAIQVIVNE